MRDAQNRVGQFMVAIGAFIVHAESSKILFVKRSEKSGINDGVWEIIYGRIDQFEELHDAVKREVFEETGISDLTVKKLLQVWHIFRGGKSADTEVYGFTFVCETSTEQIQLSSEHTEYRWMTIDEALQQDHLLKGLRENILQYQQYEKTGPTLFTDIDKNEFWY